MKQRETMLEATQMKAHVQDGQVILDEPLEFPVGARLHVVLEDADEMDAAEKAELEKALDEGEADVAAHRTHRLPDVIAELHSKAPPYCCAHTFLQKTWLIAPFIIKMAKKVQFAMVFCKPA